MRRKHLLADQWEERLPHRSLPYYSTIVFVVRKGNPKNIHDWSDLIKSEVGIVTPNPKMSGNGKLSYQVFVELSQIKAEELRLQMGEHVFVAPRKVRFFVPEYTI